MVCFVNAFAKLSTAKSASFDDTRKGSLHNENIIFVTKRALQNLPLVTPNKPQKNRIDAGVCSLIDGNQIQDGGRSGHLG
jgi:hypothetical protein